MTMQIAQRKTQSANRVERLRFAAQVAEQTEKLGKRIAQERKTRKWSRPELARRLPGVTTGNDVYRWERGKHMPRSDTLDALAKLFGITVADLYAGPVDGQESPAAANGDLTEALSAKKPATAEELQALKVELLAAVAAAQREIEDLLPRKEPRRSKKKDIGS